MEKFASCVTLAVLHTLVMGKISAILASLEILLSKYQVLLVKDFSVRKYVMQEKTP
jgi:hypothetical protein